MGILFKDERGELTKKQEDILLKIKVFNVKEGRTPRIGEIAKMIDKTERSVKRYLRILEDKGWIKRDRKRGIYFPSSEYFVKIPIFKQIQRKENRG